MTTYHFSLQLKKLHGNFMANLRIIKAKHPVYIPELNIPIIVEEKDEKRYFRLDFLNSRTITDRQYVKEYEKRDKQKIVLSKLEEKAQDVIDELVERMEFNKERKIVVIAPYGLGHSKVNVYPFTFDEESDSRNNF